MSNNEKIIIKIPPGTYSISPDLLGWIMEELEEAFGREVVFEGASDSL